MNFENHALATHEIVERHLKIYYPNFFESEERRFFGIGGAELKARVFLRDKPKGNAIIVPGRTESMLKYAETVHDLTNLGYQVFCYDHRGQGFSKRLTSEPQVGHVDHFDDFVADLKTFIHKVVEPIIVKEPLVLLGHSMGAAIVTRYLMLHGSSRFKGIILSAPMYEINTGRYPEFVVRGLAELQCLRGHSTKYAVGMGPMDVDRYGDDLTTSSERLFCLRHILHTYPQIQLGGPSNGWLREAMRTTPLLRSEAAWRKCHVPVLFLEAGDDVVVKPRLDSILPFVSSKKIHMVFSKAKHDLFIEHDSIRTRVMALVEHFLASCFEERSQS